MFFKHFLQCSHFYKRFFAFVHLYAYFYITIIIIVLYQSYYKSILINIFNQYRLSFTSYSFSLITFQYFTIFLIIIINIIIIITYIIIYIILIITYIIIIIYIIIIFILIVIIISADNNTTHDVMMNRGTLIEPHHLSFKDVRRISRYCIVIKS